MSEPTMNGSGTQPSLDGARVPVLTVDEARAALDVELAAGDVARIFSTHALLGWSVLRALARHEFDARLSCLDAGQRAVLERRLREVTGTTSDAIARADVVAQTDDGIDGDALLALNLPETHYLCRPWIPEGVTILAGRPKIGKTTLLRQIAVCASSGAALWGAACTAANVLFLSLEEGQKLMRKKLRSAGYSGEQLRNIRFQWTWRRGACGVADIRARLEANADIRFVIVDSLTRFRDAPTRDKPQFHQDYEALCLLADLVKDFPGLSVIVLHHTKKDQGDDPIADISGTYGLSAAADNFMVLRREGGDYVLHCGGRYWDEAEDAFRLRREAGTWALDGAAVAIALSPMQRQYLDRLRQEGTITTRGMATRFNVRDSTASVILSELREKGLSERTTDGWRCVIQTP